MNALFRKVTSCEVTLVVNTTTYDLTALAGLVSVVTDTDVDPIDRRLPQESTIVEIKWGL